MFFTGIVLDFFYIILLNKNLDNSFGVHGILTFIWFAPTLSFGIYIGLEFLLPGVKKDLKKAILFIYIILAIIFVLFLFLDHFGTVDYKEPTETGENLIDNILIIGSPASILLMIFLITAIFFYIIRFFYGTVKSSGVLREKFTRLTICFILLIGFGSVDIIVFLPTILLIIVRYGMVLSGLFFVLGIKKEESSQPEKYIYDDELEAEIPKSSLTEVLSYSRPIDISTEEIELYRKHTICIVCKKKLKGLIEVFICPICKSFYCAKCAKIITQLENICWSCSNPIDRTKPIKPLKEEEDIEIDVPEDIHKT
ncbi:MAG: hypothetical protein ACFFA6_10070 [Promethearchaeota archaeon]